MGATTYDQALRMMALTSPPAAQALLLVGFTGSESLSQLYRFVLDLVAENHREVAIDELLGERISVEMRLGGSDKRYFHGICRRMSQSGRDSFFTSYRMEVVPELWLLTRRARSRIFNQQLSVSDLLKQVLTQEWQLDVVGFETLGPFEPRDYVVQYRETDFNFVSRLMEEEGVYYYFQHGPSGHQMVLGNTPHHHPELRPGRAIPFGNTAGDAVDCIDEWDKTQELRSGACSLWDHCFELPGQHLDATKKTVPSVAAGEVTHQLRVDRSDELELYDYPGEYAQRFDGTAKGGGDQSANLTKIFADKDRTAEIRMQEESAHSLLIRGASTCRDLASGRRFTLQDHFNADGEYVLRSVKHEARDQSYRSGNGTGFQYRNTFTCLPVGLRFRPPRTTPKPVIVGTQTAVVVGPQDQEAFTDRYGRVKVQFHWDQEGTKDPNSSCWVRVAQAWAGKRWGAFFWPRVGHEVVVAFEEGDPDRPIIVGSVYNAENMPPAKLPDYPEMSGFATQSMPGGGDEEWNELSFDDAKGLELVYIRAQKDFEREILNNDYLYVGNEQIVHIKNNRKGTIQEGNDELVVKKGNYTVNAGKELWLLAGGRIAIANKNGANFIQILDDGSIWLKSSSRVRLEAPTIELLATSLVSIMAPTIECSTGSFLVKAGSVNLASPQVVASGLFVCQTMIATSVVSSSYTPGAGNIM